MRFGWQQLKDKMKRLYGMTRDGSKNVTFSDNVTVEGNFVADSNKGKTGWELGVQSDIALSFDDGNLRLTVTPNGTVNYHIQNVKYSLSAPDTVDITDTEGLWNAYYDGATLTINQTPWDIRDNDKAFVCYIYWDATNKTANFRQWEFHGWGTNAGTHDELHNTVRTMFGSGFGITDNADGTVDLSTGTIYDEDIKITTVDGAGASLFEQPHTPLEAPILSLDGAGADIRTAYNVTSNTYICLQDGSDNPYWNEFTGGAWQQTASAANRYMAMWLIATPDISHPLMWVMGQATPEVLLTTAIDNNSLDSIQWASLPFQEVKVLYRVMIRNAGAPYTVSQIDDFRTTTTVGVASGIAFSHASLGDLPTSGHPANVIITDTTNFNGILSAADTDVQAALETLDDEALNIDGSTAMTGAFNVGTQGMVNTGAIAGATTIDASSNITVGGTVDGRDVAADGTKLDGIEALADVTDDANVRDALSAATAEISFNGENIGHLGTANADTGYRVAGTQVVGAQGAAVADATDAASAITQLNLLLARCRAHGIIAT